MQGGKWEVQPFRVEFCHVIVTWFCMNFVQQNRQHVGSATLKS
jgi:hypothetical protein